MDDKIRKKIQSDITLNPFNKNYSSPNLNKYLDECMMQDDINNNFGLSILKVTDIINSYYSQSIAFIKEEGLKLNSNKYLIIKMLFAVANREFFLLNQEISKGYTSNNPVSIFNLINQEVNSTIKNRKINIVSAVEQQTDFINIVCNIFKYEISGDCDKIKFSNENINAIVNIHRISNLLYYLKEAYNTALWENGYIKREKNELYIKYINPQIPITKKIGEIRMGNNILEAALLLTDEFYNKVYLDDAKIDLKGYIVYSLKLGQSPSQNNKAFNFMISEISIYYPFVYKSILPNANQLSLFDMITMFSNIVTLVNKLSDNILKNRSNISDIDLLKFSYKIRRPQLVRYIKCMTSYTKAQIEFFIDLITDNLSENSAINLWYKPLLQVSDSIYFMCSNIIAPNISYVVDNWLNMVGYNLDQRGKEFEKYIKKSLGDLFANKKLKFKIFECNTFSIKDKSSEEIDLLVILGDLLLVGEIKCIKYPFDSRSNYNSYKILKKASKQVIRKSRFIDLNRKTISADLCNKKIIKVIITNYPIFAGLIVDTIPVIDYNLLESYFANGEYGRVIINQKHKEYFKKKYYSNETELYNNLEDFIMCPPTVTELRKEYTLETSEITLPKSDIRIFQDFPHSLHDVF